MYFWTAIWQFKLKTDVLDILHIHAHAHIINILNCGTCIYLNENIYEYMLENFV